MGNCNQPFLFCFVLCFVFPTPGTIIIKSMLVARSAKERKQETETETAWYDSLAGWFLIFADSSSSYFFFFCYVLLLRRLPPNSKRVALAWVQHEAGDKAHYRGISSIPRIPGVKRMHNKPGCEASISHLLFSLLDPSLGFYLRRVIFLFVS